MLYEFFRTQFEANNEMNDSLMGRKAGLRLGSLLALLAVWFLILLLGRFLWNNALVPLVPAVRPAQDIWQILGVSVLLSLLLGR